MREMRTASPRKRRRRMAAHAMVVIILGAIALTAFSSARWTVVGGYFVFAGLGEMWFLRMAKLSARRRRIRARHRAPPRYFDTGLRGVHGDRDSRPHDAGMVVTDACSTSHVAQDPTRLLVEPPCRAALRGM